MAEFIGLSSVLSVTCEFCREKEASKFLRDSAVCIDCHRAAKMENWTKKELIDYIWDVHKDIYGVRPRHLDLYEMTHEQLLRQANSL